MKTYLLRRHTDREDDVCSGGPPGISVVLTVLGRLNDQVLSDQLARIPIGGMRIYRGWTLEEGFYALVNEAHVSESDAEIILSTLSLIETANDRGFLYCPSIERRSVGFSDGDE